MNSRRNRERESLPNNAIHLRKVFVPILHSIKIFLLLSFPRQKLNDRRKKSNNLPSTVDLIILLFLLSSVNRNSIICSIDILAFDCSNIRRIIGKIDNYKWRKKFFIDQVKYSVDLQLLVALKLWLSTIGDWYRHSQK